MGAGRIRMIGFDLDGTTLQEDHKQFSDRLLKAFECAQKAGVQCVPVTGRPPLILPEPVSSHADLFPRAICSDGAVFVRTKNREVVDATYIKKEKLVACVEYFCAQGLPVELNGLKGLYVGQRDYELAKRVGGDLLRHVQYCLDSGGTLLENLLDAVHDERECFDKFNIMRVEPHQHQIVDEFLLKQDLESCYLHGHYLEVTESGVSKGESLLRFAEKEGIPIEEVMILGDSGNDISMFRTGAFKVAVANAEEEILKLADAVTLSNVEDGAAIAIEKYVLGVEE